VSNKNDQELIKRLKDNCNHVFSFITKGLFDQISLCKELPTIRIGFSTNKQIKARIGYMPSCNKTILVTISESFLQEIHKTIESHRKIISAMMKIGIGEHFTEKNFDVDMVLDSVYDLSLQFVLHHELFHLLCGHIDFKKGNYKLSEINESSEITDGIKKWDDKDELRFYFREMEADNSSIVWLINKLIFGSVNKTLIQYDVVDSDFNKSIIDLDGVAKSIGYKMLFIAIWLVISLIERDRVDAEEAQRKTHPYPSARIISCIHTIIEIYAELSVSRVSMDGRFANLTDQNRSLITEFFDGIAGPFCIFFRGFPDASTVDIKLKSIDDFNLNNDVMKIFKESSNIFFNRSANTLEGLQLNLIETVRIEMIDALRSYRYFEETII